LLEKGGLLLGNYKHPTTGQLVQEKFKQDCALQIYDQVNFKKKILVGFKQPKSGVKIAINGFVQAAGWMVLLHSNGNVVIMKHNTDESKMGVIDKG
jgi:hypothetical protein